MSKTVHIYKHTHNLGSCILGKILYDRGFEVKSIGMPVMDLDDIDPLAPDFVLIMGAPIGVYQAEHFPFVYKEIDMVSRRIEAGKPVMGVCFGAQLIAKALGSDVYPGAHGKEVGWHPLILHEDGRDHPARHLDGSKTNMFHWHGDTFDLPREAKLLASSDKYRQIYSYEDHVLGSQCHLEVRDVRLQEWYVANIAEIMSDKTDITLEQLKKESEANIVTLNTQVTRFFTEWLQNVGLLEEEYAA